MTGAVNLPVASLKWPPLLNASRLLVELSVNPLFSETTPLLGEDWEVVIAHLNAGWYGFVKFNWFEA